MNNLKDIIKNNTNLNENQKCDLLKLLSQNKIVEVYEDGSYKLSDEEISIREKQLNKDAEFIKSCEEKLKSYKNNEIISPFVLDSDPSVDGYVFCINRSGETVQLYNPYNTGAILPGRFIYPNECFMAKIYGHGSSASGPIYFLGPNGAMEFGYIHIGSNSSYHNTPNWKLFFHGVEHFGTYVGNTTVSLPTRDSIDLYNSNGAYVKSIPNGYTVMVPAPDGPDFGVCTCGYSMKYLINIRGYISPSGNSLYVSYFANTGIRSGSMYNQIDIYPPI